MITPVMQKERYKNKIHEGFQKLENTFILGFDEILQEMRNSDSLWADKLSEWQQEISSDECEINPLDRAPNQELCELLGLAEEMINPMVTATHAIYNSKRYEEALAACHFLVTLHSTWPPSWLLYGFSRQATSDHLQAISCYAIALYGETVAPYAAYYTGECSYATENMEQALAASEQSIELCGENEELADLKQKAESLKKLVQNN
jgi:tetratricopeptide (TPR) repeat protein